jgi:hypothetical protein
MAMILADWFQQKLRGMISKIPEAAVKLEWTRGELQVGRSGTPGSDSESPTVNRYVQSHVTS